MKLPFVLLTIIFHTTYIFSQTTSTSCRVEIYMLKSTFIPKADMDEPIGYFMPQKNELADRPLVANNEIVSYDILKDSTQPYYINITKQAAMRVDSVAKKIPLSGLAFAVVVNGEPVYGGYFWSHSSSYVCTWVTASAVGDRISIFAGYNETGYPDPRQNKVLMDCLLASKRWKTY